MKRPLFPGARLRALEKENRGLKAKNESLLREYESQKKLIDTLVQIRNVLGDYIHDLKAERNELRKMIEDLTVTPKDDQEEAPRT